MSLIGDILGVEEPREINTQYAEEAISLSDAARQHKIDATKDAYDRIMAEVGVDVEDSSFGADLDEQTDYAMQHANAGIKQTQFTANRMGVDMDPALQRTMARQTSLGSAQTGVDTRNRNRMDMREDRMDNMAKAIGMNDDLLQMELDRLASQQNLENIKAGMPSNDSGFSIGGGIQGGLAAYKASGGNIWAAGAGAILGAFL